MTHKGTTKFIVEFFSFRRDIHLLFKILVTYTQTHEDSYPFIKIFIYIRILYENYKYE